jgi:hypothetical protein
MEVLGLIEGGEPIDLSYCEQLLSVPFMTSESGWPSLVLISVFPDSILLPCTLSSVEWSPSLPHPPYSLTVLLWTCEPFSSWTCHRPYAFSAREFWERRPHPNNVAPPCFLVHTSLTSSEAPSSDSFTGSLAS